jgi:hypothetical protein
MQNFPQYDIDLFIEEACKMTLIELRVLCDKTHRNLSTIRVSRKPEDKGREYAIQEYKSFVHELAFMLQHSNTKPFSMQEEHFQKSKRIFESLVERKQLGTEFLDIFKPTGLK